MTRILTFIKLKQIISDHGRNKELYINIKNDYLPSTFTELTHILQESQECAGTLLYIDL